ncbi:Oidioi.mRNA.OKI2018_I69.chr2.g5499.t1.cds [Oikopleura dioica]|uniref:Cytochrome b-245 light chain n=1 Tax=Oikopleura dioica TaxID=34765 RepID=A0ABN7T083_OIKDI|nr:Oidioi.mRNA.OKI2018_I69.chr2.g5499.t1.cds [Oikopleura dioica]
MREIEFGLWANEQTLFASIFMIVGAIIAVAGLFPRWPFALVGGILCLLVSFVEWSRPARKRGRVQERPLHKNVTQIVSKLGPVATSYYFRFAIYLLIAGVSSPSLPTLLPAVCLALGSLTYFVAAYRGEFWRPILQPSAKTRKTQQSQVKMPNRPPPRRSEQFNQI